MVTKNDCILLLSTIGTDEAKAELTNLVKNGLTIDTLKCINRNRELSVSAFYEKIRNSYNNKKSKLYINIVKGNLQDADDILTTLASLQLQILLFARTVEDRQLFLRHARFGDISAVLGQYSKTYDLIPCQKLLTYIRADLKVFEECKK